MEPFIFSITHVVSGGMRVKVQQTLIVFQEKGEKGMQTSIHNVMKTFSYIGFHDDILKTAYGIFYRVAGLLFM